jgi:hypothetical protein
MSIRAPAGMTALTWWCVEGPPRKFRFEVVWVTAASAGAEKTHNPSAATARALKRNSAISLPFSKKTQIGLSRPQCVEPATSKAAVSKGRSTTRPNGPPSRGPDRPIRDAAGTKPSRSRPLHSVGPLDACACDGRRRRLQAFQASQPPHALYPETRTGFFPPTT